MEQTFKISQINNLIIENNSVTEEKLSQDLRDKIDNKQDKGDYATIDQLNAGLKTKQPVGDYATADELNSGLETKQDKGDYATRSELNNKQDKGNYVTTDTEQTISGTKTFSAVVNLSGAICTGDLTIKGNLTIDGDTYETHAEQIYSTKDYIFLREGNTAALTDGQYSGFEFIKYNGVDNGRLVIDNTGIARVGDVGDEQPLATREEEPINGGFAKWDSSNNKFVTDINVADMVTLELNANNVVEEDPNYLYLTDEQVELIENNKPSLIKFIIDSGDDNHTTIIGKFATYIYPNYEYIVSGRVDKIISFNKFYILPLQKMINFATESEELFTATIGNIVVRNIDFTSDPQTQLDAKYVKPISGIPLSDLSSDIRLKINNIPSIEANPTLSGNEQSLSSLKINGTSYKIESGASLTEKEIEILRNLLSKVTVGTNVVFNTTVEAPAFNDTN